MSTTNDPLAKYPDMPLKAFWNVLTNNSYKGPDMPMAIAKDPRCGINYRQCMDGGDDWEEFPGVHMHSEFSLTPLSLAAYAGRDDVVNALLVEGAEGLDFALLFAAFSGKASTVSLLIAKGASTNAEDEEGNTPFALAATHGHISVMNVLLSNGVSIVGDMEWYTPLHTAALRRQPEAVELLLAYGAPVKYGLTGYATPLHRAAMKGCSQSVRQLMDAGSDLNARDGQGFTPLDVALQRPVDLVIDLLTSEGAPSSAAYQSLFIKTT